MVIYTISIIILLLFYIVIRNENKKENFNNNINFKNDTPSINDIKHIIKNIEINGKYLNVYQNVKNDDNYTSLGQYMSFDENPVKKITKEILNKSPLKLRVKGGGHPKDFELLWSSKMMEDYNDFEFSIWRPLVYNNSTFMGDIFKLGLSKPDIRTIKTLPNEIMEGSSELKELIWAVDDNLYTKDDIIVDNDDEFYKVETKDIFCWYITKYNYPKCFTKKYTKKSKNSEIENIRNISNNIINSNKAEL